MGRDLDSRCKVRYRIRVLAKDFLGYASRVGDVTEILFDIGKMDDWFFLIDIDISFITNLFAF